MLDKLVQIEKDLFLLINSTHSPFFDNVMWLYSNIFIFIPIAILLLGNIAYRRAWRQWLTVFGALALMFFLCDLLSSHITKPLFERPRPTYYPGIMEQVRTLFGHKGGRMYGFISGHSTNSFAFAMFTAFLFRNRYYGTMIFLWAAIMAYSRLYLGVHFISDVVPGMIAGMLIGFLIYRLLIAFNRKMKWAELSYPKKQINAMTSIIIVYIALFVALSGILIRFLK